MTGACRLCSSSATFSYNVADLPIAALGLLNPVLAGLAMVLSSVSVVGNALRLRPFRAGLSD